MQHDLEDDDAWAALSALVHLLLGSLDTLGLIARHFHPPHLAKLLEAIGGRDASLHAASEAAGAIAWPEPLTGIREQLASASQEALAAFAGLRAAVDHPNGVVEAFRALRHYVRAVEALYPLASILPPVNQCFVEPGARADQALLERLAGADPSRDDAGVLQAANDRRSRGGFSLYVPEYYDAGQAHPLIVALHGGSGHGREFIWTWLREARTRGAILVSPTAVGSTWSLMQPEIDSANIARILGFVQQTWNIDAGRMLLTGMSDGGTFTCLAGLQSGSPFTHLAPVAPNFHPFILAGAEPAHVRGLPIRLTHGALDWMFPVAMAREASQAFTAAGAAVTYREIADLSHTYPREENSAIMDWFFGLQ